MTRTAIISGSKWVLASLLMIYISFRAASIGITQDEAFSYMLARTGNVRAMATTANTHWLNSICLKFFLLLPGHDALWKIRMLPLLCWPVYCFAAISLSNRFRHPLLGWACFALLALNPFLLFYFSQARGYAPACSFILLAIWLGSRRVEAAEFRPGPWIPVFLAAAVAVAANFTAFYFFMALAVVYCMVLMKRDSMRWLTSKPFQPFNLLLLIVSMVSVAALLMIRFYGHDLELGAASDPVGSMFGSLLANARNQVVTSAAFFSMDPDFEMGEAYRGYGIPLFVVSAAAALSAWFRSGKNPGMRLPGFILGLLFTIMLMGLAFALLFHTPYLLDRSALILYPILIPGLLLTVDVFLQRGVWARAVSATIAVAILAVTAWNFRPSFQLRYFREWAVQTDSRKGFDRLEQVGAQRVGMDLWHYSVFVNYYSAAYPDAWHFQAEPLGLKPLVSDSAAVLIAPYDHLFLSLPQASDAGVLKDWKPVVRFPDSQTTVYMKSSTDPDARP